MKYVPNVVSRKVARQILIGKKYSPTILFVGGVVGAVAATVSACRSTLLLEEVVDEAQHNLSEAKRLADMNREDYTDADHKRDVAVVYVQTSAKIAKLYAPAIVMGVGSIAALTGSHRILTKRNAAVTAAYALVERSFSDYRERVVSELGVDKDREYLHGTETIAVRSEDKNGPKNIEKTVLTPGKRSMYAKLIDEHNKNWSPIYEYNVLWLRGQQNYANDLLQSRGHVFLSEIYDNLDIDRTPESIVVGWVKGEGDDFIDFGIFNEDAADRFYEFAIHGEAIWLDFNVDGVIYDKI